MMSIWKIFLVVLSCVSVFLICRPLPGGCIRHDVADDLYRSLGDKEQYQSVCLLLREGEPNGSGVLVAPEWILTAGHEVVDQAAEDFEARIGSARYKIARIVMHPEYRANGLGHGVDLALIQLATPCREMTTAALYDGADELGRLAVTVGFGRSGSGREIIRNPSPSGTKRAGYNHIDSIGGAINDRELPDNLLIADFDHPDKPSMNVIGDAAPHALEYCPVGGDSGGGLFLEADGQWSLAGVFSALTVAINDDLDDGIYGSVMYWIRVSLYRDWITEVIQPS